MFASLFPLISKKLVQAALCLLVLLLTACQVSDSSRSANREKAIPSPADLHVVDCLLPGQVRRLGNSTYMTPRRPARTTAADCRVRGGEYVEYDRADYKTALAVWLPAAEQGDTEAQTNVGEIFERGLGGEPNYEAAFIWYRKAAVQGNSRAQYNLGTLYEQGHGVPRDKLQALNWYRKAWGLPEDDLIFQSAAQREKTALKAQLEAAIAQKDKQIVLLKKQIKGLQQSFKAQSESVNQAQRQQLEELQAWVANLQSERKDSQRQYDAALRFREPVAPKAIQETSLDQAEPIESNNLSFGKYYALIIGNQNYQNIDSLFSPYADARRAKSVLESHYGFNVRMLLDADNITLMQAINELNEALGPEDNLLIFYAGHGSRIESAGLETGYWLPTNAEAPPKDTFWVANEFVTRHLSRIEAKRILLIADSCYSGLLSSAPGYLLMGDKAAFTEDYIRYKLPKKSRLLLSSGGDSPVLDNAGDGHSVFADAFLDALEDNQGILSSPELFLRVRERVKQQSSRAGFEQEPEFKAIKGAGHEVGDFFFVRTSKEVSALLF